MSPWLDEETGELLETCPNCSTLEREARNYRAKITRLERAAERELVAKRDGRLWNETLEYWQQAFPEKRVTSRNIKSARATKFFMRLQAGATPEDVRYAIDGAKVWQWVVFGKRQRSGSKSDLAIDLEHIVSVGNDAQFDSLVEKGREMTAW